MKAVRVNLTIPGPVDAVVSEFATLTGLSKSAAIAAYLAWQLPHLAAWVADRKGSAGFLAGLRDGPAPLPDLDDGGSDSAPCEPSVRGQVQESRADRRRREREERKLGLR